MAWFRWKSGNVTDPRIRLAAKRSESRICEVVAVWAFLLEEACDHEYREVFGELDGEVIEDYLGLEDGQFSRIVKALEDRGLIDRRG